MSTFVLCFPLAIYNKKRPPDVSNQKEMLDKKRIEVCRHFQIPGETRLKSHIVQSENTFAFKNPVQVMDNIDKIAEHIHAKDMLPKHSQIKIIGNCLGKAKEHSSKCKKIHHPALPGCGVMNL